MRKPRRTSAASAPTSRPESLPPHFARVYALRSVEATLREESERMPGVETGGVLVGFIASAQQAVVVTSASGPGPRAHHGRFSFNRDREFCQAFLDRHAAATGGVIDFVGEWHKHPEADPRPSGVDIDTYRRLARDPASHLERPLVIITGVLSGRPRDHARVGDDGRRGRAAGGRARTLRWPTRWPFSATEPHTELQVDSERRDQYVRANAFAFRADGCVARPVQWLPDDAYADLLRDPATVLAG